MRPQLVITVNGPGEISAWLYPVAHALKQAQPDLWIGVCLLPCVFSSGAETEVLAGFDTVDAVCSVKESYGIILRNRRPEGFDPAAPTRVLHLGGEVVLSLLIAKRLGARIDAYSEAVPQWRGFFDRVFYSGLYPVPDTEIARRSEVVGELMVDASDMRRVTAARDAGVTTIALFPGSREYMFRLFMPFLARLADEMSAADPSLRWVMARSDFISDGFLHDLPPPDPALEWRASAVRLVPGDAGQLETEAGTRIEVLTSAEAMARADFAVSLPGTNTGEMAANGLPMVVVLPTYNAADAPLPGLAGHIGRIPLIGRPIKERLALQFVKRFPMLAIPSRRAGRRVVPELAGRITQGEIAAELKALMAGDREAKRAEVRAAMGQGGAASRIAGAVLEKLAARKALS
ncbi:glycosyltransferase family protein [Anianabacter salinae]|uniref:hypothetical protein n=1 Tax=Anianabacter salinae TaxID=2851023 RepID=UPI00225E4013|nr:hypothetical protein [Anianabacter salinae]MBV0912348.1 hypothetical protein [Anianabacter salinae]